MKDDKFQNNLESLLKIVYEIELEVDEYINSYRIKNKQQEDNEKKYQQYRKLTETNLYSKSNVT